MPEQSLLKRVVEALLDLGRHILAKGIGQGPAEHKEVALALARMQVLAVAQGVLLDALLGWVRRHPELVEGRL